MEDDSLDLRLNSQVLYCPIFNGEFLTGRRKGPFGRQMGIISHSENPNHGYVQWMGLGYPVEIPYYCDAVQGNRLNLKEDDEIEFDLIGRLPRFEATQIEPLETGSLKFKFDENLDRQSGTIFKMPDGEEPGTIQWQPSIAGACFYLAFHQTDILEIKKGGKVRLNIGDKVRFYKAQERTKDQKLAKFIVPTYSANGAKVHRYLGEVCSVKSGYGFIKRLDVDKETFFHASQTIYHHQGTAEGGSKRIDVGDKVDFSLDKHDGREVAIQIAVLPRSFPIVFDDHIDDPFTGEEFEFPGKVLKPCAKGKLDQPGIIEIKIYGMVDEIEYFERDRQNSFTILKNDKVIFNIARDRRSQRERAVNIRIQEVQPNEDREQGIVAAVKDGFGFIKREKSSRRDNNDSRMFFHSSELLDKFAVSGRRRIKMGDEVEFTVRPDPLAKQTQQGRCHATRIRIISSRNTRYDNHNQEKEPETAQKWTKSRRYSSCHVAKNESFGEFEVIPTKHELFGEASSGSQVIFDGELKVLPTHNAPGIISLQKHMGGGEGPGQDVRVSLGSLEGLNGLPLDPTLAGTMVQFKLEESKGRTLATNVKKKVFHGKVKLIKDDTYGFVVCENESEDLFFHFSDVAENDRDDLRKEHLVTFSIRYNERARKRNAFDVHLLPRHMQAHERRRKSSAIRVPKPGLPDESGFKTIM